MYMFVTAIECLNYSSQESKKQFAVYDSVILVTLKQVNVIKPDINESSDAKQV